MCSSDLPVVDDERLDLYARWHAQREAHRGWESSPLTPETYAFEFAFPHPSVHEVSFRNQWGAPIGFEVPEPLWPPTD